LDKGIASEMIAVLPRLRRFAYALTRSQAEADDLAQSTLERAIRSIDSWQAGTRMDSWLFAIARNLNLNNLRARRIRGEDREPMLLDDHLSVDGVAETEARLTFEAVGAFVDRLPEEQRSVLILNTIEGLSYKEIAAALDLPVGTVTSRIARARIALRAFVNGETGAGSRREACR
jgi:RNA polymerase sigma-70 factor (ECF subfamily)